MKTRRAAPGGRGSGRGRIVARIALLLLFLSWPAVAATDEADIGWEVALEVATGDAYRGPWRMNESRFLFVDDPTVTIDGGGGIAVAWAEQAERDIYFQRYAEDGTARFARPVNVSRSGDTFSWLPRVQVGGAGGEDVYVLWQEIVFSGGSHGGEIFFARSDDGGWNFTPPLNLSRTMAGAGKGRLTPQYWHNGSLDLARGTDGTLYAAWTEYEGPLRFSRSSDAGRTFSAPRRVAGGDDELPARGPSLAVADDGTVYLAWTVGEDADADIRIAWSTDGGRSFNGPRLVAAGSGHADAPALAVAADGHLHLAYAHSDGPPRWRHRINQNPARISAGTPEFEAPRIVADGEGLASVGFPSLAVDEENRVVVLWERFAQGERRPRGLGYATSRDGGETFSAAAVVPGSDDPELGFNGSQQGLLMQKLASGPGGRVAVVNSRYADGDASRVHLHRGRWR